MSEIILKIEETAQRHVGKGIGVIDPKIVKENKWQTGQIVEITANKKSHIKVWPGPSEDYGSGIIRIDGLTRHNIGAGIGEKATLKPVDAAKAEQITLSPIEKISLEGLQEYMSTLYEGHVFTTGDTIIVNTSLGGKTQLI
ncbi:MAG: AAA family ATPase, partial [Candidatus Nitrosotenuis sp.]